MVRLQAKIRAPQFAGLLLLVAGILSYHVRELLICWLFFALLFASLALVFLCGVLACHAGKHAIHWAQTAAQPAPVVVLASGELASHSSQPSQSSGVLLVTEITLPHSL